MVVTVRERADRSQSGFGADLLEALTACTELINTGRAAAGGDQSAAGGDQSAAGGNRPAGGGDLSLRDVESFGHRYAFNGIGAAPRDVQRLRAHRAKLDAIAAACEAGDDAAATAMVNALLTETGAVPQVVAHDGRGPHIHVSRPDAPMADRIAAHLAFGLAELVVAGESDRVRSCASPTCQDVFVDLSRNRSRRYCDSRTCGNRLHVAAYRARQAAAG